MAQLLVRNIPDALAKRLKQQAAEHGVSAEEEHRRILQEALGHDEKTANETRVRSLLQISGTGETSGENDWLFDRNDPRNARPPRRDQGVLED
jgi:plasmid stability protein